MALATLAHRGRRSWCIQGPGIRMCRRWPVTLPIGNARSPEDRPRPRRSRRGLLDRNAGGATVPGDVGPFDHSFGDALFPEDAALASRRRELGQLEIGRSRLQAALEVVKADRREEVERASSIPDIVWAATPRPKGKECVIVRG